MIIIVVSVILEPVYKWTICRADLVSKLSSASVAGALQKSGREATDDVHLIDCISSRTALTLHCAVRCWL